MLFEKREKRDLMVGPLPSMSLVDYASVRKFLEMGNERAKETGYHKNSVYLDWAIRTLICSLTADSASRIFLPKTDTSPFNIEDLFPFSAIKPHSIAPYKLQHLYVIAPVWNNAHTAIGLEDLQDADYKDLEIGSKPAGVCVSELMLAVLYADVHRLHAARAWGSGAANLEVFSLADMAERVQTDVENWYVREEDGSETYYPVLEPRMAILYLLALERYVPQKKRAPEPVSEEKRPLSTK